MKPWNDSELDSLRLLWKAGISATDIGKKLGRSRNSIIGKLYHLDLLGEQREADRITTITLAKHA